MISLLATAALHWNSVLQNLCFNFLQEGTPLAAPFSNSTIFSNCLDKIHTNQRSFLVNWPWITKIYSSHHNDSTITWYNCPKWYCSFTVALLLKHSSVKAEEQYPISHHERFRITRSIDTKFITDGWLMSSCGASINEWCQNSIVIL